MRASGIIFHGIACILDLALENVGSLVLTSAAEEIALMRESEDFGWNAMAIRANSHINVSFLAT
jgi:hypothetical protein